MVTNCTCIRKKIQKIIILKQQCFIVIETGKHFQSGALLKLGALRVSELNCYNASNPARDKGFAHSAVESLVSCQVQAATARVRSLCSLCHFVMFVHIKSSRQMMHHIVRASAFVNFMTACHVN